ncbi:MAG: hypothetical protein V2I36_09085 [Desulfopila sp.]|jgi:hypothetical protein|nr:hypothetical protein [Desulfopila sp.]
MKILKCLMVIAGSFAASVLLSQAATLSADAMPYSNPQSPPIELEADVNNQVFSGVVKRIPNGAALVTSKTTYLLSGGNFDGIINQEVNIIGKVVKEGSIEKIEVARAQLAHERE